MLVRGLLQVFQVQPQPNYYNSFPPSPASAILAAGLKPSRTIIISSPAFVCISNFCSWTMDYLYGGGLLPPKLPAFKIPAAGPRPSRTIIISSTIIDRIYNFCGWTKAQLSGHTVGATKNCTDRNDKCCYHLRELSLLRL